MGNLTKKEYLVTHSLQDIVRTARRVSGVQCPDEISEYEYQLAYTANLVGHNLGTTIAQMSGFISKL
jgi:hypothetical protein